MLRTCMDIAFESKNKSLTIKIFHIIAQIILNLFADNIEIFSSSNKFQHHKIFRCILKFCQFNRTQLRTCILAYGQLCPGATVI